MSMLNIATAALNGATILRVVTRDAVASPGIAVLTDGPQTQRIVQQGDPNGQVNPTNPAAAFYHQLVGQCTAHGLTPQQPQGAAMSQLGRMVLSQAALGYQDVYVDTALALLPAIGLVLLPRGRPRPDSAGGSDRRGRAPGPTASTVQRGRTGARQCAYSLYQEACAPASNPPNLLVYSIVPTAAHLTPEPLEPVRPAG